MPRFDIAIVGLGFGRWILDELHQEPANDHFRLSAVCDLDDSLVAKAKGKYGVKGYHSIDGLLEKD